MSKYFGFVGNKPYDYKTSKHPQGKDWSIFSLGKYEIAYLIKKRCTRNPTKLVDWSVIVKDPISREIPSLVHGFKTQHDAISYALQTCSITALNYNKSYQDELYRIEFKVGEILKAREFSRYSNAIIVEIKEDEIILLTDFGNIIQKTKKESLLHFKAYRWFKEDEEIGFPMPTLEERIDQQIELLKEAKERLTKNQRGFEVSP